MDVLTIAVAEVADSKALNFNFEKLNSFFFFFFFTSQQPLRLVACYESSGPKVYVLDVIIQL